MMLVNLKSIIYSIMLFAPPLLIAGIGCNLTTASGIINIGIDGFMTLGAFVGCATTFVFENPILGLISAGISSAIFSLIFAIFVLRYKTNEILVGFVLNIFIPAIVVIISYALFNSTDTAALPSNLKIPMIFRNIHKNNSELFSILFSNYITTYIAILLVPLSSFILYKTKLGLQIRACGVNSIAANYVGIEKNKVKLMCILISGFLYGISGSIYTMAITNQFRTSSICGQGYIALAAVLFSDGKPLQILIYSLIFGFFSGLKTMIPGNSSIIHLTQTIPYIATILVLIIKHKKVLKY